MEKITGSNVYFRDPGKIQQKPLIKHMNIEFIYWLYKEIDFTNISEKTIDWVVNVINDKIRPCLNWLIEKKMFLQNIK